MTDPETTEEQILSKLNEILSVIDQQGKKIDAVTKRIEKLEKPRNANKTGQRTCEGDCFSIPDECIDALMHPDRYKPEPGEATPKENPAQTRYRKSFWKKFE
ncbi:MAG TPA: hypothetical protein VMS89_07235 [Methanoregulaceae archaeon]|nr:hypothetical protein [Methanoregulaceae archaeon]